MRVTSPVQPALKARLHDDLTAAIRARDGLRTATLRMALAAVTTAEVAGRQARQLSDDEVLAVLTREAKRRRESYEAYDAAGRPELAARERAEAQVLAGYLPAPLSPAELDALVEEAVARTGARSQRELGAVMKVLQPEVRGRADGRVVTAAVRRRLAGD